MMLKLLLTLVFSGGLVVTQLLTASIEMWCIMRNEYSIADFY